MKKFFTIIILFLTHLSYAANFHAVVLTDRSGDVIDSGVNQDFRKVHAQIHNIAKYADLTLKEHFIKDSEISPKELFEKIQSMNVEEDDTVFFYFSGHGIHPINKQNSPWPFIILSKANVSVDFSLIIEKLKEKNPRLIIAISDSCNNLVDPTNQQGGIDNRPIKTSIPYDMWRPRPYTSKQQASLAKEKYRRLFRESKGVILVASSKIGDTAKTFPFGSAYTCALIKCIQELPKSPHDYSWEGILAQTTKHCSYLQTPYYQCQLNPVSNSFN